MLQCGADGALMSGSGPTVYGLAQKERQAKTFIIQLTDVAASIFSKIIRIEGFEKMRYKRSERIVFMTQYLMNHPNKLIPSLFR